MLSGFAREPGRRLTQAAIIAACLATIAFLTYRFPPGYQRLAGLAVVALGLAVIFLRQPALGPIAVVVAALALPFEIGTGTMSNINLALLGCAALSGLWLVDALARPERRGWARSRVVPPLLGLGLVTLVAFGVGQVGWFYRAGAPMRTQIGQMGLYLLSIAAFLLVANRMPDERWLARLVWAFLGLAAVHAVARIVPAVSLPYALRRAEGSVFWVWLAALSLGQALYNRRLPAVVRLALAALAASPFYLFLIRGATWTAGWLPPLVAVIIIFWLGDPRWTLSSLVVAAVAVLANWDAVLDKLVRIGGTYGQEWSIYTRWEAWRVGLQLAEHSPIIGFGPANYYYYTPLLRYLDWNLQFVVHNQYIDVLLNVGLLGLGCFLWFAWEAARLGWRLRSRVPEGFERAYVYAALGGLGGTLAAGMLVDYILPMAYNQGLAGFRSSVAAWLFLGGLVVLERRMKDEGGRMKDEG